MTFCEAYRRGTPAAVELLAASVFDPVQRVDAIRRAARPVSLAVLDAIRRATGPSSETPACAQHLAELASGSAAAAVTGQQLGLLGGPLYTVHKAAAAIRFARRLRAESGTPVIPIFWLQTEDHDFAEIQSTSLASTSGDLVEISVPDEGTERSSVAYRTVSGDPARSARLALRGLPHAEEVHALLASTWIPGRPLARAFADMLGQIFAADGLLCIDPRDPELAPFAAPIHRWAIESHGAIAEALMRRSAALEAAGFGAQVGVRKDCSLSFIHPEGAAGPRYRLRRTKHGWEPAGGDGAFTDGDLRRWLDDEPLRFSTSALLRPFLQDTLLPTAAYVGGPSEVAYFAQIAPLYEARGEAIPLIVPRPSWRWSPRIAREAMDACGLSREQVADAETTVLDGAATAPGPTGAEIASRLWAALDTELDTVCAELGRSDVRVDTARRRTQNTIARYIERFAANVDRARADEVGEETRALRVVRAWLHPDGAAQERTLGFPGFAASVGIRHFVERTIEVADPIAPPPPEVPL